MGQSGRPRNKPITRPKPKMIRLDFVDDSEKNLWNDFEKGICKNSNKDRVLYLVRMFNSNAEDIEDTESLIKIKLWENVIEMFQALKFDKESRAIEIMRGVVSTPMTEGKLERWETAITRFENDEGKIWRLENGK